MSKKKSLKMLIEWSNKYIEENTIQKIGIHYDDEIVVFTFNNKVSTQLKNDGILLSYLKYLLEPFQNKKANTGCVCIDPYYNRMDIIIENIDLNIIGKDIGGLFFLLNTENLLDFFQVNTTKKEYKKVKIYKRSNESR